MEQFISQGKVAILQVITNSNVHQTQNAGNSDGFIIKLSPNYKTIWKTYFGGTQNDMIDAMLIDSLENLYIVGSTKSNNSISTVNSFQANYTNNWDGFCVKLDSSSSQIWGTYIGSNSIDQLSALAHKDSSLWIVGFSDGNMLITDSSSTQLSNNGGMDNIIIKLDLNGQKKVGYIFREIVMMNLLKIFVLITIVMFLL